jgi:protein transport protein SEC31
VFPVGHSRGVLSLSWCTFDAELLLSGGKDNRTICWKPQTGEMVGELPHCGNWVFDVQWCPRIPSLISTCSFDERVSVYSLAPSSNQAVQTTSSYKWARFFPFFFFSLSNRPPRPY